MIGLGTSKSGQNSTKYDAHLGLQSTSTQVNDLDESTFDILWDSRGIIILRIMSWIPKKNIKNTLCYSQVHSKWTCWQHGAFQIF